MMYGFPPRKWTRLMLRRYAQEYLGVERLPNGSARYLYAFVGKPAYPQAVASVLQQFRVPWFEPARWYK